MPHTVLICDDEETVRALIRATLAGRGYTLVEACDGDQAIELARSLRPDLILLDMMMPGRTGLDVVQELRASPETAAMPVVMVTARAQSGDRRAAADAGADRFVAKPFSPTELLRTVDEFLTG